MGSIVPSDREGDGEDGWQPGSAAKLPEDEIPDNSSTDAHSSLSSIVPSDHEGDREDGRQPVTVKVSEDGKPDNDNADAHGSSRSRVPSADRDNHEQPGRHPGDTVGVQQTEISGVQLLYCIMWSVIDYMFFKLPTRNLQSLEALFDEVTFSDNHTEDLFCKFLSEVREEWTSFGITMPLTLLSLYAALLLHPHTVPAVINVSMLLCYAAFACATRLLHDYISKIFVPILPLWAVLYNALLLGSGYFGPFFDFFDFIALISQCHVKKWELK
ncbi:hypothetical protein CERSUDRAFT_116511 [Gelatoporia subvermispora B]|uniref:Uncharacterized protein n=1 Tax=Ceriporiopsis subvermispora (strain B) TaxID=914234 RepID=M2QSI0_CERS8|nr:hypothetical protein CERSUDRAFT_116511 [Gelatoporia subvermispora B]